MALPASITFADAASQDQDPWTTLIGGANVTAIPGTNKGRIRTNEWKTSSGDAGFYWNADTFADDHYSEATQDTPNNDFAGPIVRIQTGDTVAKGYLLAVRSTAILRVYKVTTGAGGFTQLGADISVSLTSSSVCRIRAEGTGTVTLTVSVDGTDLTTRSDSSSPYNSGAAGMFNDGAADQATKYWGAGNVAAAVVAKNLAALGVG